MPNRLYTQAVASAAVNGVATVNLTSLTLTAAGTYTVNTAISGLPPLSSTITVMSIAQTITLPDLSGIVYGDVATVLPASTSAGLPITFTVTGPAVLNGMSLTTTGAGIVTLTATQAGDAAHTAVSTIQSFTVAKVASTTSLSTSGVAVVGSPLTLTGAVATKAGTASGTVTFLNGSTVLGTATLVDGSATLTLATLPTGMTSLVATYSGDANHLASTSMAIIASVQDFSIAATTSTPNSIVPGASVSYGFLLTPGASGFSGTIALTATGLPAGATYSFSPAAVTPGSANATSVLTVQTAATTALNLRVCLLWL